MEMVGHEAGVLGPGDGGAHCGTICDASYPTFMLTHWLRDRRRGPRLALPQIVKWLGADTARAIGLLDRGVLLPGPGRIDWLPRNASTAFGRRRFSVVS
jgi:N-acyl-D-aspartate/D-glutamate deacylase